MTKLKVSGLLLTLASSTAFASLNLDFRGDYKSTTYNTDAATGNVGTFNVKTGRLDYQGKLNDDVSFRLRWAFNKDASNASGANDAGLQPAVEYAYVTQKLNDNFGLTLGRLASEVGAFEGNTSGADLYMTSAVYSGKGAVSSTYGTTGATSATKVGAMSSYLYVTGAKATAKYDNHEASLLFANPIVADSAQSRLMTGLVYKGAFLDKSLNLIGSYHSAAIASSAKDDRLNSLALGVNYMLPAANQIGLDYISNEYKHFATVDKTEKSQTFVLTYAYKGLEEWTPMAKYFETTETPDSATSANNIKTTGTAAVIEFKPKKDQTFRYHASYSYTKDKTDNLSSSPEATEVLVGVRINADFLK